MVLFLASQSSSRRKLLSQSKIDFIVINQEAHETLTQETSMQEQVLNLAKLKMAHISYNDIERYLSNSGLLKPNYNCLVLTADTLVQSPKGKIIGKPANYEEAQEMIKASKGIFEVSTGFCLYKIKYLGENLENLSSNLENNWKITDIYEEVVTSTCYVNIEDKFIDKYLNNTRSLSIAGALEIEDFGLQFVKEVHGSYSSILGLPLFELREALNNFGFFDRN